jgi:hypothetical protein
VGVMNPRCHEYLFATLNIILNPEKIWRGLKMGLLCSSNSGRAHEQGRYKKEAENDLTFFFEMVALVEFSISEVANTTQLRGIVC